MKAPEFSRKRGLVSLRLPLPFRLRFLLATISALMPMVLSATPVSWWSDRGIITPGATPSDFAAANQGQVKYIAEGTVAEFNQNLPGGAGAALNSLIAGWAAPTSNTSDYNAVNVGQLKALAKVFYDRLIAVGFTSAYPWAGSSNPSDDYAMANIGQVKNLFNLNITLDEDVPPNGLWDWWENYYFGYTAVDPDADPDGDGLTNLQEMVLGTDPNNADTNGDGYSDSKDVQFGIDPVNPDLDGDGVSNADELLHGTNLFRADSDGDGVNDNLDAFPLDPARWDTPTVDPSDHTAPTISLDSPAGALLL